MKSLWNSFVVAFSMYSKIPMPRADWTRAEYEVLHVLFPLGGPGCGGSGNGWFYLARLLTFIYFSPAPVLC